MPSLCSVPDCAAPASARDLCAKHYMRARRHGDPDVTRKRGRKPAEDLATIRRLLPEYSPRTQARYARALRLGRFVSEEFGVDLIEKVIREASRPNGSMNVNRVVNTLEVAAAVLIASAEK